MRYNYPAFERPLEYAVAVAKLATLRNQTAPFRQCNG